MEMTQKNIGIMGVLVVGILLVLGALFFSKVVHAPTNGVSSLVATTTAAVATSSAEGAPVALPEKQGAGASTPFPVNQADTISSWVFVGPYSGNETLINQAHTDINKLSGLLGGGAYDDYDLYNGIANDYTSLGDGQKAYEYYNRAIAIHPTKGLAYANLAYLMSKLRAFETAADAFTKAVAVEPGILEYQVERVRFLTNQFPKDDARILAAFADAAKQFGDTSAVLSVKAQWLTGEKKYVEAVAVWQTVKSLSSQASQAAIDAEIARLKAKQ
jgi:tetratricopeptide (TPR) repeat protein